MPSASAIFVFTIRINFSLNPCFILWLSRSHKSTTFGKEEKVLIYNEKELNNDGDIGWLEHPFRLTSGAIFSSGSEVLTGATGPCGLGSVLRRQSGEEAR
ncbi:hypothetical protein FE839_01195 [Klebsiella indica]|uniref:Uncharacterized protein n=1 Tax=Klebsiella indica TaxID=2582917 RepID=A0A5R9LQH3_9ENTR|nr:hypothetical protein FE839_01195 [Klebsiella indica]